MVAASPLEQTQAPLTDRVLVSGPSGKLSLDTNDEPFTFLYSTADAHDGNWIGLYRASGGGPVNESFVEPSLLWHYAPDNKGSVHLAIYEMLNPLEPGDYQAYFLSNNGYKWLADPITVTLNRPNVPIVLRFPVENVVSHNARQFESYSARVDGLVLGSEGDTISFQKIDGDGWIHVDHDGKITGVPGLRAPRQSQVVIRVKASSSGSVATIRLVIPVRRVYESLVHDLRVLSFNMWFGGTQVRDFHEKQVRFILESKADIVGLQETTSDHATRLGKALGWYHWQSSKSVGIISRYPFVEEYGEITRAGGVRISLDGQRSGTKKRQLNFWTIHTDAFPYGPYDFCYEKLKPSQVLERETSSHRAPQVEETLNGIQQQVDKANSIPVIFTGDFNAPSHRDWVESTSSEHCGISFSWPTSVLMEERGFIDSFRAVHPNPDQVAGNTWSPLLPLHDGETGPVEPQDRIDFTFHKGPLSVVDSHPIVAGKPRPSPNHVDNEWTSDHRAVLTHYLLPW